MPQHKKLGKTRANVRKQSQPYKPVTTTKRGLAPKRAKTTRSKAGENTAFLKSRVKQTRDAEMLAAGKLMQTGKRLSIGELRKAGNDQISLLKEADKDRRKERLELEIKQLKKIAEGGAIDVVGERVMSGKKLIVGGKKKKKGSH